MQARVSADADAVRIPFLRSHYARLALVAVQLGLVLLVARLFNLEQSVGFNRIAPIIFVGFIVHALAPLAYRKQVFLVASLAAIEAIFPFPNSLVLVGIGLALIGTCHLPLPHTVRVVMVVVMASLLALFRAEVLPAPIDSLSSVILPILGAMFMFRIVIYLYDLRHMKKKLTVWDSLSYFFLLPNVCFPLFPVVDLQAFLRTHYDKEDVLIYQKGVLWIFRGFTHLIMYRLVYHYFMPSPDEVVGLFKVLQYMLATYLLYLRISGQFHVIVGILCLFGYNLPETHHLYYLASSFNDYWRRINIYWKDFMMKIFFYPSFMKLRKIGTTPALVIATLVVFAGTWILHSYQWFWLQGSFPITWPDALFWGILGVLVAANSVWESKRPKKRAVPSGEWSLPHATRYSLRVLGMFVLITTLWTLWSSESVSDFVGLIVTATQDSVANWALFILILAALVAVGVLAQYLIHRGWELTVTGSAPSFARSAAYTLVGAVVVLGFGQPDVSKQLGEQTATIAATLKSEQLNERDEELLARGYYEGLLAADKYTSGLATIQTGKPKNWDAIMHTDAVEHFDNVLQYRLVSNMDRVYKDERFVTNQWGMHDIDYPQSKPADTRRVAFMGASYEMGAGVPRESTFDALAEGRLNAESADGTQVEILNFSVGGYSLLHNAVLMERHVPSFDPDVIMVAVHSSEFRRMTTHLVNMVEKQIDTSGYPEVTRVIRESGVTSRMSRNQMRQRLDPYANEIVAWSLARIATLAEASGLGLIALYVPLTEEIEGVDPDQFQTYASMVNTHGYDLINLDGAFAGHSPQDIQLAPWDKHLGTRGHELLADKLYSALKQALIDARKPTESHNTSLTNAG